MDIGVVSIVGYLDIVFVVLFGDCFLCNYWFVIVCIGEYVQFYGGIVLDVFVVYNVVMIWVNGVYEWDFMVYMEFIDEMDQVIFLDGVIDFFINNSVGMLLSENQGVVDGLVGFDNYDVGYVFSISGGGVAFLVFICIN